MAHASLKFRLGLLVAVALLGSIAIGASGYFGMHKVIANYNQVTDVSMAVLKHVNEARNAQRDIVVLLASFTSSDKPVSDPEKVKQDFAKDVDKYEKAVHEYSSIAPEEGELGLRTAVESGWKTFLADAKEIVDLVGSTAEKDISLRGHLADTKLKASRKDFRESFQNLVEFHDEHSKQLVASASEGAKVAQWISGLSLFLGVVFVLIMGFWIASGLSSALSTISQRVNEASRTTLDATQQMSSASEQLAASSTEQASSLQQVAASIAEISSMVGKNAENSQKTQEVLAASQKQAQEGQGVMQAMTEAIGRINESNTQIGQQIETNNHELSEILKVIADIESKAKVINEIVFQTKLLSFNASVEAARAGEMGKGFSVVAEEVGNLAKMSGEAAEAISTILNDGSRRVEQIVQSSKEKVTALLLQNKEKLDQGVEIAERCRVVFDYLVENVNQSNGMVVEIAAASKEQAQGVREVDKAINQLDTTTSQNATSSGELSTAAQSLVSQGELLNSVASELSIVVTGKAA